MDYDFANSVSHTCIPPSMRVTEALESSRARDVTDAMQRDVDSLATSTIATPLQIWDELSTKYYQSPEGNSVVRGMPRGQVLKRDHHARTLHYGTDMHGRVEVPPSVNVKNSNVLFLQFHHVWGNGTGKLDRVIGWANPALLNLLRYENITVFLDGTFRCVPDKFAQLYQLLKAVPFLGYPFHVTPLQHTCWNHLQFVSNACGKVLKVKEVVCDFEAALINAACKRRMLKECLHHDQIKIAMLPGFLDMLTVIEKNKIAKQGIPWVKSAIKAKCEKDNITYTETKWSSFWKYFECTWLKLFPPKFWYVHGFTNGVVARTNNLLERFNRELNAAFGAPHPSLPRFIQTVEDISRRRLQLRDDISRGRA
ncbi:Hypothetical protein PHPALM_16786 [Phytophthora palmivora]|uniref:MULE transposase domain-containing protein n=1 Tax=Phytophthora palmivora TaxID=4796 RepID=A0A2P4XNX5_9STRA|nr:Hypothetical protein PHPALM_16786 [Phytophthora palmivora]